ncbi:MAG: S9 family peptidase [Mucilaginibacter polytrichastri]|nr:S9 family peptidase [Mucilaginibacter polytrichastri]
MTSFLRFSFLLVLSFQAAFAQTPELTVDYIMRDPEWMGVQPDHIRWDPQSSHVYFEGKLKSDSTDGSYSVDPRSGKTDRLSVRASTEIPSNGTYNRKRSAYLYSQQNGIFLLDLQKGRKRLLIQGSGGFDDPRFSGDEQSVLFRSGDDLFRYTLADGSVQQLVRFVESATDRKKKEPKTAQDKWLKKDQEALFAVVRKRDSASRAREKDEDDAKLFSPKEIATGGRRVDDIRVSPDGRFIVYRLIKSPEGNHNTQIPQFVNGSGYTEDLRGRTKVGSQLAAVETLIYDTRRDSVYPVITRSIPGIKDLPDYAKDYPDQLKRRQKENADRDVVVRIPEWNENGSLAVVEVSAQDNKDRWIMRLNPETGALTPLDRQRDEAWIGGPGVGGYSEGKLGWVDENTIYFQSEATGYSHVYTLNIKSGVKKALTAGSWEVQSLELSADKKHFYYTANTEHPGITHFYRIAVSGGKAEKLTSMKGLNEISLSPDEKWLAIRYSYSNKPWELYLQPNRAGAAARQITRSVSDEFKKYPWRDPEMITFTNRYGKTIYARLYRPKNKGEISPAVVFVHGAGYLQNVHYGWSSYFREYMFHNLLADHGYTVLDVDYTASSGYGRDHRTGIYRHMGGKDLDDEVDGARLLVEKYGVNKDRIGIYGGSYGGFMTLMALFTQPEVFGAGAALRSVTDWAHYNQGYTANILNDPVNDEKAYRKSSPIYFASGLKKPLLMCHGMVDVNVHYQDIVRLSQRLIELKKDNWELASYPVEDHGFVEPESWTDEYKRIFRLFETTIGKK